MCEKKKTDESKKQALTVFEELEMLRLTVAGLTMRIDAGNKVMSDILKELKELKVKKWSNWKQK